MPLFTQYLGHICTLRISSFYYSGWVNAQQMIFNISLPYVELADLGSAENIIEEKFQIMLRNIDIYKVQIGNESQLGTK